MRVAVYARVPAARQAQSQTIDQQLDRLRAAVAERGWELDDQHVYRDDGFSGASLGRPGLDRLRDHAALADLDVVLVTAPDRLARNYVHQVLLIDELAGHGCQVEFLDRPMSQDPHDQLLLQIRGAVAEYERTLIAGRMRRGRQAKLRAGMLLPWTTPPFGYRLDPGRPRLASAVRVDPGEAALVAQLFDWYLEPQATVCRLARRLIDLGVATPRGKPRWNVASVRGILRNPAYAGRALTNRTQVAPARRRRSAMLPAGPGQSHAPRPEEDWIAVPVPPIVSAEAFAQVQAKLDANQQGAARNTRHEYLLRALVSCGACRLSCTGRQTAAGYRYYLCRGRTDPLRVAEGERCTARYIPAEQLDELVWADLCALLTDPSQVARALARARGGAWLPQELQARQAAVRQALGQLERQQQRLPAPTSPRWSRWRSWNASARNWTAAAPRCSPSSVSWTPRPGSGWNSAPSPTGSRHSARRSGQGWPPPRSSSGGCWPSCSSTAWSSPTARSRSATSCRSPPMGRIALFASCGKTISLSQR
jgi:site-specific DNA recombinase